jgi:predicted nucleotide-binding protein
MPNKLGDEISKRVFVVHGHDDAAKQEAARLLMQLDLEPIILSEQENEGRTIIEKFEHYSDVGFAVVLLTPDDVGETARRFQEGGESSLVKRARQNVVFEMGFFYGRLGRQRVCALLKGDTERPSDISGIVYTFMDSSSAWRFELAKEMKAAGLPIDMNKL